MKLEAKQRLMATWWDNLTADQKKTYIKNHPTSKYAREAGGTKSDSGKPASKITKPASKITKPASKITKPASKITKPALKRGAPVKLRQKQKLFDMQSQLTRANSDIRHFAANSLLPDVSSVLDGTMTVDKWAQDVRPDAREYHKAKLQELMDERAGVAKNVAHLQSTLPKSVLRQENEEKAKLEHLAKSPGVQEYFNAVRSENNLSYSLSHRDDYNLVSDKDYASATYKRVADAEKSEAVKEWKEQKQRVADAAKDIDSKHPKIAKMREKLADYKSKYRQAKRANRYESVNSWGSKIEQLEREIDLAGYEE